MAFHGAFKLFGRICPPLRLFYREKNEAGDMTGLCKNKLGAGRSFSMIRENLTPVGSPRNQPKKPISRPILAIRRDM